MHQSNLKKMLADSPHCKYDLESHGALRKTILCLLITHDETFMAMHRLRDYIVFPRGIHSSPLGQNGVNITDDNFKRHVL